MLDLLDARFARCKICQMLDLPGLYWPSCKHLASRKKLANDQHSSLLGPNMSGEEKKFYNIDRRS